MFLAVGCAGGLGAVVFHKTSDLTLACVTMGIVAAILIGIDIMVDTSRADRDK